MPIYEYKCEKNGKKFSELVGMSGKNPPCPKCKSDSTSKLMSRIAGSINGSSSCSSCSTGSCSTCGV